MDITVTAITAALLALLFVILSFRVIRLRGSESVSLGDGGNEKLQRAIRGHGNCAEYAPIGILLLLIAELQGGNGLWLMIIAAALVLGRVAHGCAFAFTANNPPLRVSGMILTFGAILSLAATNLVLAL
ncbi:MAG: MAPEG family protein [Rhodospirillaceae bacterium]|nr:MAPEG family protein [Rhodospirillaceae bacterium]MDD9914291.1 MAPEG family protein [Rhodospirillaceae bacterium]MDD9926074.1 MAPEG family protein [Rhodospirillaceae bacterium]